MTRVLVIDDHESSRLFMLFPPSASNYIPAPNRRFGDGIPTNKGWATDDSSARSRLHACLPPLAARPWWGKLLNRQCLRRACRGARAAQLCTKVNHLWLAQRIVFTLSAAQQFFTTR